ncbi:MAG: DUF4912 domain-containing protein [Spirochaetes bacterium]|nr:MAG: DUF4912 domain-containing protein [Spirochaetota bacterium]
MTREYLQSLSYKLLKEIAFREGIKEAKRLKKEVLIDLILEAMQEERDERERFNNPAMQVEEKKYENIKDEEMRPLKGIQYKIPERYNETKIVLLLRDPLWAYAYWDLNDNDILFIKNNHSFKKLILRVYESGERGFSEDIGVDSFDIPVKLSDNRWYINLPHPGREYYIELICLNGGEEKALCTSNTVRSPRVALPDSIEDDFQESVGDIIKLSGISELHESDNKRIIPQRIISIIETKYQSPRG